MKDLISIIVPVYNTSTDMFEKCVNSLVSQTYRNIEIILVDDGSTSGIENECDRYSIEYSNVIVIHKSNGGLSSARNAGMKSSNGQWIMFVDSDDWIDSNTCSVLCDFVRMYQGIDFITYGYVHEFGNKTKNCIFNYKNERVFLTLDRDSLFVESLKMSSLYESSCWKLFNKDFLIHNNLLHDEKIRQGSEDLEFMLRVILTYDKTLFFDKRLYHYVMNLSSITNSFNEDNAYRVLRCFEKMEEVICTQNCMIQEQFYIRSWYAICSSIISGFMNPNNGLAFNEKKKKLSIYLNDIFCKRTMSKIKLHNIKISRAAVYVLIKYKIYYPILLMAIIRGKQKNR